MTPVFLILGFLDAGKTTFIKDTLMDDDFTEGKSTLLIQCEDGEVEYDEKVLAERKVSIVRVEKEEDFRPTFMMDCVKNYKVDRVMIEWNGTWNVARILEQGFPRRWELSQIITIADAQTFEPYMNNMRQMMNEMIAYTELVIFNKCNKDTKRNSLRRLVRTLNRSAQCVFEAAEGEVAGYDDEVPLPYDMNAPIVEIADEDYGIFYLDILDNIDNYVGKTVRFLAMVYRGKETPKGTFVPGRFAMTCCAADIAFIGFLCRGEQANYYKTRDWCYVTCKVEKEYMKEYEGEGPVYRLEKIEPAKKPEDHVITMN
ncbi:MAG: GTPase [Lachnospiraceae bacterium]|nr:GTPase [Lachnospiraceae bacterium]